MGFSNLIVAFKIISANFQFKIFSCQYFSSIYMLLLHISTCLQTVRTEPTDQFSSSTWSTASDYIVSHLLELLRLCENTVVESKHCKQ